MWPEDSPAAGRYWTATTQPPVGINLPGGRGPLQRLRMGFQSRCPQTVYGEAAGEEICGLRIYRRLPGACEIGEGSRSHAGDLHGNEHLLDVAPPNARTGEAQRMDQEDEQEGSGLFARPSEEKQNGWHLRDRSKPPRADRLDIANKRTGEMPCPSRNFVLLPAAAEDEEASDDAEQWGAAAEPRGSRSRRRAQCRGYNHL